MQLGEMTCLLFQFKPLLGYAAVITEQGNRRQINNNNCNKENRNEFYIYSMTFRALRLCSSSGDRTLVWLTPTGLPQLWLQV